MKKIVLLSIAVLFFTACASGGSGRTKKTGKNYSCSSSSDSFMVDCD